MLTKQVIISSSGLKNVVLSKYQEADDFIFILGKQKICMKSFFAEFISPVVSHLHQTDPTINIINFNDVIAIKNDEINNISSSILTPDIISFLHQISSGNSINISEDQAIKLRFLSILLGNDELYNKLNELFPQQNYCVENINSYLKDIECCYYFSHIKPDFDFNSLLSFVSNHFSMLDREEFLKLRRLFQYMIISHPKLKIESEDSLFDIIAEIIEEKKELNEIDDVLFLEQIDFRCLNNDKLHAFVDILDFNKMSGQLWYNLCEFFLGHSVNKSKRVINKINEPCIIIGGYNYNNKHGIESNNKNKDGLPIISPPIISSLDPSSILSYSSYCFHSVIVTIDEKLMGIGDNFFGAINSSLEKTDISQFTEFSIKDSSDNLLVPISAVCSNIGTLYMLSKSNCNQKQLVYCSQEIDEGNPVYIDIGNQQPVALFSGFHNSAAINSEGEIIFINYNEFKNSINEKIEAVSLPDGEKASSIACLDKVIFVLSSNGRVFSSAVEKGSRVLSFSIVEELANEEIVCISGTWDHCLAVSKNGSVFGYGTNEYGQLGLGKQIESISSFTEILSLRRYKIRAAYAGSDHSLFETFNGKILACGDNQYGELLLDSGPCEEKIYSPTETLITDGASFCIAGGAFSAVFLGDKIPSNMPNKRI